MTSGPDFNLTGTIGILIEALWPTLAPFAYSQFLSVGKGAVLIDLNRMTDTVVGPNSVECIGQLEYLRQDDGASGSAVDHMNEYDPETEVVLIIDHRPHAGEANASYRHVATSSLQPTPKELFEAQAQPYQPASPFQYTVQLNFNSEVHDFHDPKVQKAFLRHSWELLATTAYQNYLRVGRGAILIDIAKTLADSAFGTTSFKFNASYVRLLASILDQFKPAIRDLIKVYNPDEKVIILFFNSARPIEALTDAIVYVGPLDDSPSPKRVFEISQRDKPEQPKEGKTQ